MRCLAKAPDARFQDGRELAAALGPYATFGGMVSVSRRPPRGSSAAPPPDVSELEALLMPLPAPFLVLESADDRVEMLQVTAPILTGAPHPATGFADALTVADRGAATLVSRTLGGHRPAYLAHRTPLVAVQLVAGLALAVMAVLTVLA